MQNAGPLRRTLALTVGVLLITGAAAVSIVQTPHFQPVSSSEVDGALTHLVEVATSAAGE